MDLEMAGTKTVLVNRWDKRQKEAANGKSFGFEFEKATTRAAKGCEGSTGHHRIIKYVSHRSRSKALRAVLSLSFLRTFMA